eukprot:scaffold287674_cov22-Tisochrysis_lutea.AAC.1
MEQSIITHKPQVHGPCKDRVEGAQSYKSRSTNLNLSIAGPSNSQGILMEHSQSGTLPARYQPQAGIDQFVLEQLDVQSAHGLEHTVCYPPALPRGKTRDCQ